MFRASTLFAASPQPSARRLEIVFHEHEHTHADGTASDASLRVAVITGTAMETRHELS